MHGKNSFLFISNRLHPFTVVPRFASHTKLKAYPEELLVVLGISQDWVDSDFKPVFSVIGRVCIFMFPVCLYLVQIFIIFALVCFVEMSALDYILLDDPSGVEIKQREIPEGGPSADDASVITFVTGVKFVKKEVSEASSGAGDASSLKISALLKKLNETNINVPERPTQALEVGGSDVKVSKPVSKKKIKGGSSKPASLGEGASGEVEKTHIVKGDVKSMVGMEKEKEKVKEKAEKLVKERVVVDKGKGQVEADSPIFVPQWKMEVLSYPYVEALSQMVDCPIIELEALEPEGLNNELCEYLLSLASIKRAFFETSDEEGGDVGPSTKKLKVTEEPALVSSMSIPIDTPTVFCEG
ncbi:hypothetical protein Hanom_Chr06g00543051 [Helianthus anomalus]